MASKVTFVLSVVVAVLYREMLFTEAQKPDDCDNKKTSKNCAQPGFPPQGQKIPRQMNPGQMYPGQMNPGQMKPGQMNQGQMNTGQMYPGQMNTGQMKPGQMNQGQMNTGQMYPGQMNPGQMNPGQMIPGQMNPGQMNPGKMIPGLMPGSNGGGQMFPFPNSAGQAGAGRRSTYDTLSMDVSKQVIRQLTPLAEVALSAPAAYGQAWAMAPGTAVRGAQPILNGAASAVQWG